MANLDLNELRNHYPLLQNLISLEEVIWSNPKLESFTSGMKKISLSKQDVKDAEERLNRFARYIEKVFPETKEMKGIIESPIVEINSMKEGMEFTYKKNISGKLLLKCDNVLPISGSIKARGGIYEVLKHAESLAIEHNLLTENDDYSILDSEKFRDFYSRYSIIVGSTGNLGLSIGIMSAKLGFKVTVHMSSDAKQWKKDLLRSKNVNVVEHADDYSKAVEEGRKQAATDATCHFVDDENSRDLFLGYSAAACRLDQQLKELDVTVDEDHPLFVYLPCGVGGGPGGVTFGLKLMYQDNVHCFFGEPTHSACMLLGLMTGLHDKISVQEIGLDNKTDADGLAVGRASRFVGKVMEPILSGSYTVSDKHLYKLLKLLFDTEGIHLEPSALAGMIGPIKLLKEEGGYIKRHSLTEKLSQGTHIVWATGGSMVPKDMKAEYYQKGIEASSK
ncbi:D-serine ammonia-lyase [Bacillus sp. B1-b2]|uniref:D-serine ammonia-lyase n=1 Tax=Bacillus sp. B1-b2 TaxID=2653201 RepID=UPI00126266C1|nr:D-serine ammonia-lyase [Bacillus sp. B1-b2]KAB7667177.1 D-serine ammonia-lyase [Bacillus sp. B1-b2]